MKRSYRVYLLLIGLQFALVMSAAAQPGQWVWIKGDSINNSAGNFGTQGVPSATNNPPCLYEACEWTDLNGNFWLYGGVDNSLNNHNDLWKYDPTANVWTWMTGTAAINDLGVYGTMGVSLPTNRPPSRGWGSVSWVDQSNNLWMFGGNNAPGKFNDLWMYNITTNQWTWMKGSNTPGTVGVYGTRLVPNIANTPGARYETSAGWVDNAGDFWLFGGGTTNANYFNDLWRYNVVTNTWTWMKGSNLSNQVSVYGTLRVEDSLNTPGAREVYCRWKDNSGNFWLFGGRSSTTNYLNDLWKFNPVTNNWTWMNGSQTNNDPGTYGTQCIASSSNSPKARYETRAAWTDPNGNLWFFGGFFTAGSGGQLNDLWMYCIATNQWIWINGANAYNPAGRWGTIGVSSPLNQPNGRTGALAWTDKNDHLYLFGGWQIYNDLWKFTIDNSCGACATILHAQFNPSDTTFCSETGRCIDFYDHSTGNPTSWTWSFPGANPDTSTQQNPTNICYNTPGTYPVTLIVSNSGGTDTLSISPLITFGTALSPPTITQHGDTLFSSQGASYQWYFNGSPVPGATDSFYVAMQHGTYSVQISENGCNALSSGVLASVNEISAANSLFKVFPNPAGDQLTVLFAGGVRQPLIELFNVLGEKLYSLNTEKESRKPETVIDISSFANGVYILRVTLENKIYCSKIIKE